MEQTPPSEREWTTVEEAEWFLNVERANHYQIISAKIVGHYTTAFPSYAFTDLESALDLMLAEITTARAERDTAQAIAADKILEADARGAIAVNCAKALSMMAEGKIDEDTAVKILNDAETQMLRACEWLNDRDKALTDAYEKSQKEVVFWKAANDHSAKRFHEVADELAVLKRKGE